MASLAVVVDGVKCRLNFKRANIVVGTTAAERKLVKAFDFKGDATQATAAQVEALVRARPGFNELVARAVAELPAADEALVERSDDAERAQARAAAEQQQTEVLVCRPNRTRAAAERQQTELFQFTGALRDRATGTRWSRKRPRPAAAPCADSCQQEDCKRARAERDEALRVASAAQEQLDAVRAEMGSVWLLLVTSEAFAVPENLVHATAEYEAGYLVVRGRWFALEQRSPRGYKLLTEEVLVVVNTMIRVPWVLFNGSAAGKEPRESRSGLYILGEEWYNRLFESV